MATILQRPPTPAGQRPPARSELTPSRGEDATEETPRPRRIESGLLFLVAAGIYFAVGYTAMVNGVVVFDALDRLTRAYMVWHNDPAKLAAIGFVFPPLTTILYLPFTIAKSPASSLIALPLSSALFGGSMVVAMNRLLARCSVPGVQRWIMLALFALNPLVLFYASNGMSEIVYLSLLTVSLYCFMSWFQTREPRFLVVAGLAFAMLVVLRYSFGMWALVIAVMFALGLARRGADRDKTEGLLVTLLAPAFYAMGVWILFNWLIVGDPLSWLSGQGSFAVNSAQAAPVGDVGILDVLGRTGELTLGVYALGIVVVPALVVTAIGKRDEMSWWLVILALTGIVVMGADALIEQDYNALAMRNALPVLVVCVAGAGWLYRCLPTMRALIWPAALAALVLTGIGSWNAMAHYPFQSQEQAFARVVQSGGADQTGTRSIGGFLVGTKSEQQMAAYVKAHISGRSKILTDNAQTFGVVILSGRPEQFFDRADRGDGVFEQVVEHPQGRAGYMLMAKHVNGDLIRRRYPTPASRFAAGLTTIFETQRYLLVSLAGVDAAHPNGSAATGGDAGIGRSAGPGAATAAP
jgi:hypothetical protein